MTQEAVLDATAGPSPLELVWASVNRPVEAEPAGDDLPQRAPRDRGRVVGEVRASAVAASEDRTATDYGEFKELAASVRQWMALARAKDGLSAASPDGLVLPAAGSPLGDLRGHERADVVVGERTALLIEAGQVASGQLPRLLERVRATYGGPAISRAYADWADPGLAPWFAQLREHGVQAIHNFDTPEHRRSLAALTLDALDLVERHAVTSLVLVGDLGPALPLVTRLRSNGVTVAVFGPASTPDDLRRDADDFIDIALLDDTAAGQARGKHCA